MLSPTQAKLEAAGVAGPGAAATVDVLENGKTAALSAPQAKAAVGIASKTHNQHAVLTGSISSSLGDDIGNTIPQGAVHLTTPRAIR